MLDFHEVFDCLNHKKILASSYLTERRQELRIGAAHKRVYDKKLYHKNLFLAPYYFQYNYLIYEQYPTLYYAKNHKQKESALKKFRTVVFAIPWEYLEFREHQVV